MSWEQVASAVAWEIVQRAVDSEIERSSNEAWLRVVALVRAELKWRAPAPSALVPEPVSAHAAQPVAGDGYEQIGRLLVAVPPKAHATTQRGQLDMFGAPEPAPGAQEPTINEFEGPCVVCGNPGRRRLTFPPAFAAAMPPPEPTCRGHELVAEWGIPLTAEEATAVFRGTLVRSPTGFRYREVRGVTQKKMKAEASA